METSLSGGQAMRTHGTQSRSMLCVVRKLRAVRDLRHIAAGPKDVIIQMITVQFVSFDSIVANRGAGEQ